MTSRNLDGKEKARQILEHATMLFAERGYNATTVDAVAERAKVAKGTVYRYFESKHDLFFAVFDAHMEHFFTHLSSRVPNEGVSAGQQLRDATKATFQLAHEIQHLFPLMFEFWAASASSEMRERFADLFRSIYASFRRFVGDIIRRGIDNGEFDPSVDVAGLAAVLVGSFDGMYLQTWFDHDMDAAAAGDAFIEVFLRGLKTGDEPRRMTVGGGHA